MCVCLCRAYKAPGAGVGQQPCGSEEFGSQGSWQVAARSQSHARCQHPPGNSGSEEEEETGQAAHPEAPCHPNTGCALLLGSTGHTGDSPQFSCCQQCPIIPEIQLPCRKVVALPEAVTLNGCGTRWMAAGPAPASAPSPFPSGFPPRQRCAQHPPSLGVPPTSPGERSPCAGAARQAASLSACGFVEKP